MAYKIAFYDTKPYDERSFTEANEKFGFDIRYYKGHLNMNNVVLTKGVDAVSYTHLELCDSAFGACRFQQFYFNITYFQKSGFNFLILYCFDIVAFQT